MLLYYILVPAVYLLLIRLAALWLKHAGGASNVGAVLAAAYGVLFVGLWVLIALLMRFSLLQWYVDPIAAAEGPLLMYVLMIAGQMKQAKSLHAALRLTNRELCDDGGMGWIFLTALFLFGLVMSFSIARKKGQSISFRLLAKAFPESGSSSGR